MPTMKKLLLGTTALAVGGFADPAIAADPIKIGVSGYYQFYAMAGAVEGSYALNGSSVQNKGLQFIQEGEIHFIGQTKLDNGTTFGVRVELEGWNPAVSGTAVSGADVHQIDEAFLYAFGDWGRVEFGSKDDAPYIMYYGAPSALPGWGFFQPNTDFKWTNKTADSNNMAAFRMATQAIDAEYQDVNRINYYTPRFYGLQIGVSYAPKIQPFTQQGGAQWGLAPGPGTNTGGVCGFADATTANGCPTNDNSWQDAWAIGANYLNKFGDVAVAVYGAYSSMTFVPGLSPNEAAANTKNGANFSAWKQAAVGLQFSYAGLTAGGSFIWDNNGLGTNYYTGADNDTRSFAVGIMYETGSWELSAGFGVAYNDNGNGVPSIVACNGMGTTSACQLGAAATPTAYFGSNPNAGAASFGAVSASTIEIGANYILGPGITIAGGAIINNLSGPSNAVVGQSWTLLLGMELRF
jgi:outer membrane protein OmpU